MPTSPVQVEEADGVMVVSMDDGKVNAMSRTFVGRLADALETATGAGRPVVVRGNAKAFSAGLDLREVPTLDEAGFRELIKALERALHAVLTHEAPVVAAVTGPAIAGGAVLAQACDHAIGTPTAPIGATELEVGVPFPPRVWRLMEARLAPNVLRRTILDPVRLYGADAVAAGWLDAIDDDPVAAAIEAAARVGGVNPVAFRPVKRALNQHVLDAWDELGAAPTDRYVAEAVSAASGQAIRGGVKARLG